MTAKPKTNEEKDAQIAQLEGEVANLKRTNELLQRHIQRQSQVIFSLGDLDTIRQQEIEQLGGMLDAAGQEVPAD